MTKKSMSFFFGAPNEIRFKIWREFTPPNFSQKLFSFVDEILGAVEKDTDFHDASFFCSHTFAPLLH